MKQITVFIAGLATALAVAPAFAEDLTAGKTPAQLFRSDCAECHRSPSGLTRERDAYTLAGFLREHYTSKSETAAALAAYVSGFAGSGAAARRRGAAIAAPPTGERPDAGRRHRGEGEASVPRPPRDIATPRAPKSDARTPGDEPGDETAPVSSLRSHLSSEPGSDSATPDAGKPAAPKARKRRNRTDNAKPHA